MMLGALFSAIVAVIVFPALIEFGRDVIYGVSTLVAHFYPGARARVTRAFRLMAVLGLAYISLVVVLLSIGILSIAMGNETIFAVTTFVCSVLLFIIHQWMYRISRFEIPNRSLPSWLQANTRLRLAEPRMTALLIVILNLAAVFALFFPHYFYNGLGAALLVFLLVGLSIIVAFPTDFPVGAKIVAVMTVVVVVAGVFIKLFPATAEAAMITLRGTQLRQGRENLLAKLAEKPVMKLTGPSKAWLVNKYENGDPVKDQFGFVKTKPCRLVNHQGKEYGEPISFPAGQEFKTLDIRVSVDAGEPLVEIYIPNSDGSWVQDETTPKCYVPVSKTPLSVAPTPTPAPAVVVNPIITPTPVISATPAVPSATPVTPQTNPTPVPPAKVQPKADEDNVGQYCAVHVSATKVYKSILVKQGQRITISATGQVNSMSHSESSDGTYRWVGPEGWQGTNPGFIANARTPLAGPLPAHQPYMALAVRISPTEPSLSDGQWLYVGKSNSFVADRDGYIYLVVNEKVRDQSGVARPEWFNNNQGGFDVEVNVQ